VGEVKIFIVLGGDRYEGFGVVDVYQNKADAEKRIATEYPEYKYDAAKNSWFEGTLDEIYIEERELILSSK
jgi:hypothetical protein